MTKKTPTKEKAASQTPAAKFRAELNARMPLYKWTVHTQDKGCRHLLATGIQTSGFNRLSTLEVARVEHNLASGSTVEYIVKSAGFGAKAAWEAQMNRSTLASALRALQDYYAAQARHFSALENALQYGRGKGSAPVEAPAETAVEAD